MNLVVKSFLKKRFSFLIAAYKQSISALKYIRSRAYVKKILKQKRPIFLELGAGDKKGDRGWLTIDVKQNCDIYWDMRRGLPFPDECVQKIYSSHFFEHLSFREILNFLDECRRVLAQDGYFSICVPNARLYILAYINSERLDQNKFLSYNAANNNLSSIDYINYIAYMDGEHKHMFDEESLVSLLRLKGFRNVRLRKFDSNLDLESRDCLSIYAEAEK